MKTKNKEKKKPQDKKKKKENQSRDITCVVAKGKEFLTYNIYIYT